MAKIEALGPPCFGAGLIGCGVLQLIYGDFVLGRAPAWPASWPGGLVWAYASGAFFIGVGVAVALRVARAGPAALVAAALIFGWALVRQLPLALADGHLGGDWTKLGKAVTFVGGCLAVGRWPRAGGLCLGAFMVLAGIQHFLFPGFVATLVPAWIPGPHFWTDFAGVALIAGGAGMNVPPVAGAAATLSGVMIFSWVFLLHIPRALAAAGAAQVRNEWTAVFEALAFSGIAFVVAGRRGR